jgi:hypothetical protein
MKRLVALAAVAACAAVLAGAADSHSRATVAFSGTYRGNLQIQLHGSGPAQLVIWGAGSATGLGPSSLMGTGPVTISLCPSFSGTATFVGKSGQVFGDIKPAKACRSKGTTYSGAGTAEVLGGTGRFAGISGVVAYSATADSATATFTLHVHGTLTTR